MFYARIATHGYEYEQFYAFLPLWPAVLRSCATRGIPLATCAVCINFLCHCIAACILYWYIGYNMGIFIHAYGTPHTVICTLAPFSICSSYFSHRLSLQVVSNRHAALATLLFILNPASVFMTVPYTESLFAMLSFAGMLCWKYATQQGRLVWYCAAALCFAMATLLRSNGMHFCVCFQGMQSKPKLVLNENTCTPPPTPHTQVFFIVGFLPTLLYSTPSKGLQHAQHFRP